MGSAKYIGRVGALAVALGVGSAVTGGYGIASAEPDRETAPPGVTSPHPRHGTDKRVARRPAGPDAPGSARATIVRQQDLTEISEVQQRAASSLTPAAARQGFPKPQKAAAGTPPPPVPAVNALRPVNPAPTLVPVTPASTPSPVAAASALLSGQSTVPGPAPVGPAAATRQSPRPAVASRLISGPGLTPGSNPLPGRVAENPLAAAILGWVRRLERTFLNKTPTTDFNSLQNVQVDGTRVVGYLDPGDRDGDALTYTASSANGGAAAFDPATAGKFTYTAPDSWNGATPWTDTVTFTVSDEGAGWHLHGLLGLFGIGRTHETTQTVAITIAPLSAPSVNSVNGVVDGAVPADNATLTYRLDEQSVDSDFGEVALDAESGQWTFTPSVSARTSQSGPARATFTILVGDGEHTTPIQVNAPILRAGESVVVPLPEGATPNGNLLASKDGSLIQASYDPDKKQSYVTVIDSSGKTRTSDPLPGNAIDDPVPGKSGAIYQKTYDEDADVTYLNVIGPDGKALYTPVPGKVESPIVVGPTGAAYLTSVRDSEPAARVATFAAAARAAASQTPAPGSTTFITVARATGEPVTFGPIPGVTAGELAFAADGTAYQTTYTFDPQTGLARTYVTVIAADAASSTTTSPIDGIPQGQLVVRNGSGYQAGFGVDSLTGASSAFMTTVDSNGVASRLFTVPGQGRAIVTAADGTIRLVTSDAAAEQTYVTTVSPTDVVTISTPIPGDPTGSLALRSDGAVLQTTFRFTPGVGSESFVTVVGTDGQGVTTPLPAGAYGGVVLAPDGVAYQPSIDYGLGQSYVTVLKLNGSVDSSAAIPGTPTNDESFSVSPTGIPHFVTDAYDPVAGHQTYVTTIDSAANVRVSDPLPGTPIAGATFFGADGTVRQVTDATDGTGHTSYVTVLRNDGAVRTTALPGEAMQHAAVIDPDGVVYVTSVDSAGGRTFLTAVDADGSTRSTYGFTGAPAGSGPGLGPDGKVYLTTYATDAGTGAFQTFVFAVDSDVTVLSSAPLPGDPPQGVVFGPGGTLYQATSVGTFVLNTSGWQLHRAPVAGSPAFTVLATDPTTGAVSGTVNATDPDGDTMGYSLDGSAPSTVVVDPTTAAWTFTPTADQRAAAFYGSGPDRVSFDVIVTDGEYLSVVRVSAAIDPSRGATIVVPAGAAPAGPLIVGPDGTAYLASRNTATNQTFVTVIGADGIAYTSDPLPGSVIDTVVPRTGGGAFLLTYDGSTTYLGVVDADGTATATALPGQISGALVAAPDGTVYQTTVVTTENSGGGSGGGGLDGGGLGGDGLGGSGGGGNGGNGGKDGSGGGSGTVTKQTFVSVAGADGGVHISDAMLGAPQYNVRIAPDGTAYQTTFVQGTVNFAAQTYVSVIGVDGSVRTTGALNGDAAGQVVFGSNGIAFQSTYLSGGPTTISVIGTDGAVLAQTQLPGQATGEPVASLNGSVVQTTYDSAQTYVNVVDSSGAVLSTHAVAGSAPFGPVIDAAGTAYQIVNLSGAVGDSPQTFVVVVRTDGLSSNAEVSGVAYQSGIQLDNNGHAYQITNTAPVDQPDTQTIINSVAPGGSVVSSDPLPGVAVAGTHYVTATGVTYQTTVSSTGTYVSVISADGQARVTLVPGTPVAFTGVVVDAGGAVYQATTDTAAKMTYVTVITPDGVVLTSPPMPGTPARIGWDGGSAFVYQTTYSVDPVTGVVTTFVGQATTDGSIRLSPPIPGYPSAGVVVGADGTVYQTTDAVSTILDPGPWVVIEPSGPAGA